jgi:tetratricopeptide (TPR) repeat protein
MKHSVQTKSSKDTAQPREETLRKEAAQVRRGYQRALEACRSRGRVRPDLALAAGYRALEFARQLGPLEEGSTSAHIAFLLARLGDTKEADRLIERAISLVAPLGDRDALGRIFGTQASVRNNQGRPLVALKSYMKALRLIKEETTAEAALLAGLGLALQQLGRPLEAVQYLLRSIEVYQMFPDQLPPNASNYGAVAAIYMELGDLRRARSFLEKAEQAAVKSGDLANHANVRIAVGSLEMERGNYAAADKHLANAERMAARRGFRRAAADALSMRAECARRAGKLNASLAFIERALPLIDATDEILLQFAYQRLGDTLLAMKQFPRAIDAYEEALTRMQGNAASAFEISARIAECHARMGESARAFALLSASIEKLTKARKLELSRSILVEKELANLRRGSARMRQLEIEARSNSNALAGALKEIERQRRVILEMHRASNGHTHLDSASIKINSDSRALLGGVHEPATISRRTAATRAIPPALPRSSSLLAHAPTLTPTELRIAEMLALSIPTKEIALLLSTSTRTIEWHRTAIRKKLKLRRKENLGLALKLLPLRGADIRL